MKFQAPAMPGIPGLGGGEDVEFLGRTNALPGAMMVRDPRNFLVRNFPKRPRRWNDSFVRDDIGSTDGMEIPGVDLT